MIRVTRDEWQNHTMEARRKVAECKCGCGMNVVDLELSHYLDEIFKIADVIYFTSWNRCEKHNKKVGGVKKSLHTKGMAVDLVAAKIVDGEEEIMECEYDPEIKHELGLYDHGRVHIGVGSTGFWDNRTEKYDEKV